jgi:hypothetical protein
MTLSQFKEKYIDKSFINEKGIYKADKNGFKNDEKIIRNLSQISYRLLNFILYSHLFFARLITDKNDFDKYLPKGMSWVDTLYECWNILKNELLKENIDSIEKFMNYMFVYLFPILNKGKSINNFEDLIELENNLESIIQKIIKDYKKENKNKENNYSKSDEKDSFINLIKEKYTSDYYIKKDFPFYEYFYYTNYLDEEFIIEKLKHMDDNKYPVLRKYLENMNKTKDNKNKYSLDNLYLFNNALNLINEKYNNNISREDAKKNKINEVELYYNNKELIDNFIKFYNKLKEKDNEGKIIELSNNSLCDFFIDDDNEIGKTYKKIYINFIKQQNEKIENLLDNKIEKRIFDRNSKNRINIQQINENEIFTLNLPEKVSFIDILFNSSYREILDSETRSYELYKEYEINYDLIEEKMTDLLLRNKKLLNENNESITNFVYNNETFKSQTLNLITLFKKRFNYKNISIYDKVSIYKFSEKNKNNTNICKNMINDFIILIKFLNNKRKEDNANMNDINEESKIYEVLDELKEQVSPIFPKLFENNDGLTIEKTSNIFEYYLKLSFEDVKNEIINYQEKLDNKSKEILNNYFNQKDNLITKKDFACAIRLFISLVLFPEEDKQKKIKSNSNNLINYLKSPDFWQKNIYDSENFNKHLNQLKLNNAKISQIISLYEILDNDIEDNFYDDVKKQFNKTKNIENDIRII